MQPASKVRVITQEKTYEGLIMPNEESENVFLKLDSGYNIGIAKRSVKKIEVLEQHKPKKAVALKAADHDKNKPTISILHTGGTIASKVDYKTGAALMQFSPEDIIQLFPEIAVYANIKSRKIGQMWSQDMRFCHYNTMAKEAKRELDAGADGVVITHGTDTMHYSSSALAFALEGLAKPVLLVGAQRSSDRGSTDAALNLINAVYFAAKSDFAGVAICMHHSSSDNGCAILPATKTRKMHTSRRDAFKPINAEPIALVDHAKEKIAFLSAPYPKKGDGKVTLKVFNEKIKVAVIYQHTNMFAEQFSSYKNYDGLVIESTGLGNLPTTKVDETMKESEKIKKAIAALIKKGVVVVQSAECLFGRLNLSVYSNAREMVKLGILGDQNGMTTETTFIKLAWLLSNYKKDEVKRLIMQNLRGELSERNLYKENVLPYES